MPTVKSATRRAGNTSPDSQSTGELPETKHWDTLLTSGRLANQDFIALNFRRQASKTT